MSRVALSDGRTNVSLEDALSLAEGYNALLVNGDNLLLEKASEHCGGYYIKWVNSLGGFNYWLLPKGNENLNTKDRGTIYNDYSNMEDTISPFISLGKDSSDKIVTRLDSLKDEQIEILRDLLDSPKVYLFTGTPFSKNTFNDWLEVNLKDGSFRTSKSRGGLHTLDVTLELAVNNTYFL